MIASITKLDNEYIARYERHLNHSVEEVWTWLTDNHKLSQWFLELRIDELRKGGFVLFDMGDGTYEEMEILELNPNSVLEYTWGEDKVRFELSKKPKGSQLVLIETIKTVTDHTPKDLAGWHVCLDVIEALLDGNKVDREEEWKKWYEKYKDVVEKATK